MKIWICKACHAHIPQQDKPDTCPLCGQRNRGFDEGEREDPDPEDKKYSELYKEVLKELESYNEGCEPESLKYCCDE